jgi:hypothetical protein
METLHHASGDPFHALPRAVFSHVILTLRAALPRPLMESAEDGALRDRAVVTADVPKFGRVSGGKEGFAQTQFETNSIAVASGLREAPLDGFAGLVRLKDGG